MRYRDIVRERVERVAVWSGATITVLNNPTRQQFQNFAAQHRAIRGLLANNGTEIWLWDGAAAVHTNLIQELGVDRADCIAFNDGAWSGPVYDHEGFYPAVEKLTPYRDTPQGKRKKADAEKLWADLMADPDFDALMRGAD